MPACRERHLSTPETLSQTKRPYPLPFCLLPSALLPLGLRRFIQPGKFPKTGTAPTKKNSPNEPNSKKPNNLPQKDLRKKHPKRNTRKQTQTNPNEPIYKPILARSESSTGMQSVRKMMES
jgi:hypothetical protein